MTQTFTPNDVLRYVYGETNEQNAQKIENALLLDEELMELYDRLKASLHVVNEYTENDENLMQPSDRVVGNVLQYSREHELEPVK